MRRFVSLVLGLLVLPALVWGQAQVINGNRVHAGWVNYGITAGTATAYTLTFTPALQGYVAGQCFLIKPHVTNTGTATLNVQAKGAKALVTLRDTSLVPLGAGELLANRLYQACYDGTSLQLMGTAPDALAGLVCDGVTQVAATIQALLDTVPLGTRVELPAGSCMLNAPLTITRSISLAGQGMDHTFLKQTVANVPVLTVSVTNVHVAGLTLMHTGIPVAGGDGLIVRGPGGAGIQAVTLTDISGSWNWRGFVLGCVAYSQAAHLWAHANNWHGFEFLYDASPGCGIPQWDILHAISQLNLGAGFYGANTAYQPGIGPWLTQTVTFANNQGGYIFNGSPGFGIHDLRLHNVLSSADNVAGIYLDTYGGSHLISEAWVELTGTQSGYPLGSAGTPSVASNTGHCLGVTANNGPGVAITGGLYWNCAWSGVAIEAAYTTLNGGTSLGNGQALHASLARRAGVHIGGDGVSVSGHSFSFPGATTLHYLHLQGGLTDVAIGLNAYAPGLTASQVLSTADAIMTGAKRPILVAGLTVQGPWQVLNATAAATLHSLSEAGTPSWPNRRGQATVVDTNTSANVALSPVEPDATYFVQVTPVQAVGSPAAAAFTVTTINKSSGGFEILVLGAPGAGKSVVYDWLVHR